MFSYSPYTYGPAPYTPYDRRDAEYLRALADERAARAQYQAARRAQEEARARAAHARFTPYSSYFQDDDYDDALNFGYPGYDRRALLEQQRRRAELAQRARLEQERRARIEEEQRLKALEEERLRRLLAEEQRQREAEERFQFDPFLSTFDWRPPRAENGDLPSSAFRSAAHRAHTASPPRRQPFSPVPATSAHTHSRASSVPPKAPTPVNAPSKPSPPTPAPAPKPTPQQEEAANKIQSAYRIHTALRSIANIRARFDALRTAFVPPPTLDYTTSDSQGAISVPTSAVEPLSSIAVPDEPTADMDGELSTHPPLAYTPANTPLHAYDEDLNRLLGTLDAIESHGDMRVRNTRRELVRAVEREAERVERWKSAVWKTWVGAAKAAAMSGVAGDSVLPNSTPVVSEVTPVVESAQEHLPKLPVQPEPAENIAEENQHAPSPMEGDAEAVTFQVVEASDDGFATDEDGNTMEVEASTAESMSVTESSMSTPSLPMPPTPAAASISGSLPSPPPLQLELHEDQVSPTVSFASPTTPQMISLPPPILRHDSSIDTPSEPDGAPSPRTPLSAAERGLPAIVIVGPDTEPVPQAVCNLKTDDVTLSDRDWVDVGEMDML